MNDLIMDHITRTVRWHCRWAGHILERARESGCRELSRRRTRRLNACSPTVKTPRICQRMLLYWDGMPASFTTFAHFTVSDLMKAANCSLVEG